jgi:hypothetical protein
MTPASPTRQPLALPSPFCPPCFYSSAPHPRRHRHIFSDGPDSPHCAQALQSDMHELPMRRLSSQARTASCRPQTQFGALSLSRKGYTMYRVIQDSLVRSLSPFSLVYLLFVLQVLFYLSPGYRTSPCSRISPPLCSPLLMCNVYVYGPLAWPRRMVSIKSMESEPNSPLFSFVCLSPQVLRSFQPPCAFSRSIHVSPHRIRSMDSSLGLKVKPFKTLVEVEAVEALRCGHTQRCLCLYIVYPGPHGCASPRVQSRDDETHSAH